MPWASRAPRQRHILWLLLVSVLLVSCADAPPDHLRFGIPSAPVTLDPRFTTDAQSDRIARLLHRPLVGFDERAMPVPELAEWQVLDPLHYRFTLRPDMRFNSGRAVTATDVVTTYRSVLDPATGSPHRESLSNIDTLAAHGERAIDFTLHRADSLFPATLVIGIMAAQDVTSALGQDAWTDNCGPFVRVSQHLDGRVVLRRVADGEVVEFIPVKDVTVRALKLLGGELDIAQGSWSPEIFRWLAHRPGLRAEHRAGTTFSYLGFNLASGPTADRRVRAAVAHAIDRAAITEHLFGGAARLANTLFPPEHWAAAADLEAPAYDPAAARALLTAAGYGTQPLVLEYKTSSDYFRLRIATVLQQQLAAVGIDLRIRSLDWGTFYGDVRHGRFQLYGLSWVGLKLPDIFRYAFHSDSLAPDGANRGAYRSAAADALIERAEAAAEHSQRPRIYRELEQRLLYDLPYVPLWFEDQLVVSRSNIAGYTTNADGHFDALAGTTRLPTP